MYFEKWDCRGVELAGALYIIPVVPKGVIAGKIFHFAGPQLRAFFLSALMTVFTVAVVIRKLCAGGSVFYLGTNCGCLGISCYDCFSDGYKLTPRQLQRQRAADEAARQKLPRLISLICFCFHEGPSHNPEGMQMHQETLQCEKYAATPRCRHTRLKLINAAGPDPEQQQGKRLIYIGHAGTVCCSQPTLL